ncbi:5-histidylcysteine sulfoxide synthase [Puniceicoccaceae bacterium K14]|nr:5-histidylcysteine sulfoxide synthase [Puniceicoccaceae bacterium K14]
MNTTELKELKTPYTVKLDGGDPEEKREEIRRYFHETYDAYEILFEALIDDQAYYKRADALRHPIIFYYGHTATFFMNKLILGKFIDKRINPKFESMFAIGVDEMSWDDLNDGHYSWPEVKEVTEYRQQVRQIIDDLISSAPISLPINWESPFWTIMMGIEHERIHLETTSVLIRQLPIELLDARHSSWQVSNNLADAPENKLIEVPGAIVTIGKQSDQNVYGWDNEYGVLTEQVEDFKASKFLVSNKEFLEFINDNGYRTKDYWTDEGWNWNQYEKATSPRFWIEEDGAYKYRSMLDVIEMPWSWPVETNYLEAKAFCNWKAAKTGKPIRLPSEEEWYRLHEYVELADAIEWEKAPGNLNLEGPASAVPVNTHEFNHGFFDVMGNVWQHTETPIRGFAGFQVHPLYDDFSTPTFDTKHNIIKGGSWISTGNEILKASRYAFRRHFYQHAGFRYIESDAEVVIPDDNYETDTEVIPYCEFNYGPDYFNTDNYPEKIAQICLAHSQEINKGKALSLGCTTGRSAFELAVEFKNVTGIDSTARMIRIGVQMKDKGYTQYVLPKEGEIHSFKQRNLQELGLDATREKVEFMQADISNMKDIYSGYDLILVDTILERTYKPENFLKSVHRRLNTGGILVISSTYDWQADATERENWLGGFKVDGENVTTQDKLESILGTNFKQVVKPQDVPFVLRKNKRSYDHKIAQVTVWKKS